MPFSILLDFTNLIQISQVIKVIFATMPQYAPDTEPLAKRHSIQNVKIDKERMMIDKRLFHTRGEMEKQRNGCW